MSARLQTRSRRGSASVEFAIVLVPFLLLLFGITEFGRMMWTQSALQFAVEKAARCIGVNASLCGSPGQNPTKMQAYAESQMVAPGVPASAFTYTAARCGNQVSASTTFWFVVPGFMPASATLTAQSCHPA